ncbi:uncharacterized protein LOC128988447 isoform X2 [Macrosteles quadrilineatus]|uniref:uncharacterized protein LOC128988447 isoform X2 n=1 Tax=Macrosteles quadrilineatus TaxID=74068 RepID=UPI0023E1577B|nr:uncharacterized protein LOC128988447 isoform X2 [Macrosteles quadrilineatus]
MKGGGGSGFSNQNNAGNHQGDGYNRGQSGQAGHHGSQGGHHGSLGGHHGSLGGIHGNESGHNEIQGGHHGSNPSTDHIHGRGHSYPTYSSHTFNPESDPDFSDDDLEIDGELYLNPGEPYGADMLPVDDPYIHLEKAEEANREWLTGPLRPRKTNIKVRFWEEGNEYYDIEENDSPSVYNMASERSLNASKQRERQNSPLNTSQGSSDRRESPQK